MAPKVTSSSNRNKRSSAKPVTKGQNPQRANRQATSRATVSQSGGGRGSGARVTNASQRTTSGSARVTGGARPALPPGRSGGALVRQGNAKPENPRRTNARNRQATASRGTAGPSRVGQPAGSANRMFGANVVNRSVNRAVTQTNLRGALAKGAAPTAIAGALLNAQAEFEKLKALLKNPKGALSRASSDILSGKPYDPKTVTKASKPTPKPQRQGPAVPARLANAPAAPKPPKPPAATASTRASAPSRSSSTSAPARTPSRPTASAPSRAPSRSSTPARPAASRPAASAPKPPSATASPKVAGTSGIGPVKSGAAYASQKGSVSESVRQLREMRKRSEERQKKGK